MARRNPLWKRLSILPKRNWNSCYSCFKIFFGNKFIPQIFIYFHILHPERHILSIDLKSFFASCECIARGLDPFKFPLVVANPNQGGGAITLAVTPYLKKQGVPSRGRIFEIPKNVKYTSTTSTSGKFE